MDNNMNEDYIITSKKYSLKLIEKNYFDALVKVEGDKYFFEPLDEIKQIIELYDIHIGIINDSLSEALEPMGTVEPTVEEVITVEPVNEVVIDETIAEPVVEMAVEEQKEDIIIEDNTNVINEDKTNDCANIIVKSRRVLNKLAAMGYMPLSIVVNKYNKREEYLFENSEPISLAFNKVIRELPKVNDKSKGGNYTDGLTDFDSQYLVEMLNARKREYQALGINCGRIDDIISKINDSVNI